MRKIPESNNNPYAMWDRRHVPPNSVSVELTDPTEHLKQILLHVHHPLTLACPISSPLRLTTTLPCLPPCFRFPTRPERSSLHRSRQPAARSARVFSALAHGGGRGRAPPRDVLVPSPSRRRPQARPLVAGAPAAAARAPAAGAAQKEVSQGGRRVRPAPPRRGQRRLRA
jgi:hypothetical protein